VAAPFLTEMQKMLFASGYYYH